MTKALISWEFFSSSGRSRSSVEIGEDKLREFLPCKKGCNITSDEAKYITGIELTVDGGILAGSSASPKKEEE